MKRVFTYLMIVSVMFLTACSQRAGSGNVLTEMRNVEQFNSIIASGDMSLTITRSDKCEVKVTADDNIIGRVDVQTQSGILYIECRRQPEESNVSLTISMPDIQNIETQGCVSMNVAEGFVIHDLELRTAGSGNIDFHGVKSDGIIKILNRGSGNISLAGSVKTFSCVTRDAGNVFADMLDAESVVAKVSGSGSIFVKTFGNMNVIVAGSGSVVYSGKPSMISKYITGSGTVKQRM
ncbi:MAG: DUF2807 domain-containing protein [Bacteroidales bacterium]|nr:DUF2807 domain-containing protein [Bacteroidales bacterium]